MPNSLRRPSVPKLKCFPWASNKDSSYVGVVEETGSRALESPEWRPDRSDVVSDDVRLPPSNSSYDLAVFLRTTGPRGRQPVRASDPTSIRSKSIPRRLLGHLREYWKPTHGEELPPGPAPYKYDERLRAWVRESSDEQALRLPDSVVQRTTSDGKKYFELKGPPPSRTNGVFSRGGSDAPDLRAMGSTSGEDMDQLILRDMTSDQLLDDWLAGLENHVDSRSDSARRTLVPSPTSSAADRRLSFLLPASAEDGGAATKAPGLTRASSTTGGRLSLWAPPAWSRDSISTVVLRTRCPSEPGELNEQMCHRASLWELEDGDSHVVVNVASTHHIESAEPQTDKGTIAWPTPPQSPRSPPTAWPGDIPSSRDRLTKNHTSHTFYASEDSDIDVAVGTHMRERRDTEPASGSNVVPGASYRSSSFDELAYRVPTSESHGPHPLALNPSDQVLVGKRRPKGSVPTCSTDTVPGKHPATMTYIAPKYSPEARDFFMEEITADAAPPCPDLSDSTRNALLYATAPERVFCGPDLKDAARVFHDSDSENETCDNAAGTPNTIERGARADATTAAPSVQTYRPSGPFSSQVDLTKADRSMLSEKRPRHVHSEELLGRPAPNAWNQTKPLPEQPHKSSKKPAHISTLSRSTSSLHSHKARNPKYTQAPTPPPEKELPALPSLPNHTDSEHPGIRAERARAGMPPWPGACEPTKNARKTDDPKYSKAAVQTPTLRKAKPYVYNDLRSIGTQAVLRPVGDSARRLADMEMLEKQLCEIQSKVIQLSAMVVEVLTKQY